MGYITRMVVELDELSHKIGLLEKFSSDNSNKLDISQISLMGNQELAMKEYSRSLEERVKYEKLTHPPIYIATVRDFDFDGHISHISTFVFSKLEFAKAFVEKFDSKSGMLASYGICYIDEEVPL